MVNGGRRKTPNEERATPNIERRNMNENARTKNTGHPFFCLSLRERTEVRAGEMGAARW
jgi:hypothetical protein